ncbi:hypothetical protein M422DRAFT_270204 [Sphaerobolus stellatus SS14]|uniref:Uncharacterized protein n=1 Tax=Sphaerobolus stellatus (strain SS14) TaxID=990650 RepID=A0A0C9TGG1_SPHS4|nr:hypothetical protein M422DRAFT_270204 [Sphaerobolus stellatus SS14]
MSYTSIFGNFTVSDGKVLLLYGKTYALYASELITEDFELRGGDVLVDNTAPVFLYGSIIFQSDGRPSLIEALNLFGYGGPIGGAVIPKFCPRLSVLGRIGGYPLSALQGYQAFKIYSSSSVKDEVGQNCFMAICNVSFCSGDLSRLREGSVIGIVGPICFKDGNGLPMLSVEAVTNDSAPVTSSWTYECSLLAHGPDVHYARKQAGFTLIPIHRGYAEHPISVQQRHRYPGR